MNQQSDGPVIRIKLMVHMPYGGIVEAFAEVPQVPSRIDTIYVETDDGVKEMQVTEIIGALDTVPVVHVAPIG